MVGVSDDTSDLTPHERSLFDTIHNLKAARQALPDDAYDDRIEIQYAIYAASQELAALGWQKRQRARSPNHEATGGA